MSDPVTCNTCGTQYPVEKARLCLACKTYRNPVREWLTNFNANGWTAFLAVVGLTASTAIGLADNLVDHVNVSPSVCRSHQIVATVVNGQKQGILLSGGSASFEYKIGDNLKSNGPYKLQILATSSKPFPDINADHFDSDYIGAGQQAYLSMSMKDVDVPILPPGVEPDQCSVKFTVAYRYGIRDHQEEADAGSCPCGTVIS